MLKKLLNLISAVLALNFLAVAGGVGFLVFTDKLDKAKVDQIRELILASDEAPTTQPTTEPAQELPPDSPIVRLDALLADASGRSATEQVEVVQNAFDTQSALLERKRRELEDQFRQLKQAKAEFDAQRQSLLKQEQVLKSRIEEQDKLAQDEGFQQTLALYRAMPPKRAKEIMLSLPDDTVVRYLQAMEPRQASGILKEFKTPEETSRAQAILERMRQASAEAN